MTYQNKMAAVSNFEIGKEEEEEEPFVINNYQIFLIVMNLINHVLVLATVGFLCYVARDLSWVTNQHALLCTIGYVLLMAEAIVTLAGENTWTFYLTRRGNSHLHWILQVIGAICSVLGVVLKYIDKTSGHFTSIHAILGIISVICIAIVFIYGLPALFAGSLRNLIKPVLSKFIHNFLGIFCFVTGMASQIAAYHKNRYIRKDYGDEMVWILTITTLFITIFSLPGSLRQLNQQFRGILRVMRK